ncbi:ATP-grasp domain-containing protein [Bacillus cereus group sp. MYBK12-2]|uniref:Uncharacterized protein n=2 Tax=Bacillus cereus group TaxID=86661 RepID=A0A151V2Q8_BACCE|nr:MULTISPECIES: hypothetical protein [Bacillus cereus group]EJR42878.1 hypothetical protein IIK_05395 [Bacillus cereus VD102]KLA01261.1 hypothetical protein B4153_3595 [Bacillus cereus]KMP90308.1 hypothetical protein TU63_04755 [Bacillus cereus]KXY22471.1 hypothetical protein AT273_08155 [Bacillus cereus]KYQ04313.1 hypothetical protein B4079_0504 [Bacillus cereus]
MIRRNKSKGHALVLDTGKEEVNAVLSELHDYRFTRLMDPPSIENSECIPDSNGHIIGLEDAAMALWGKDSYQYVVATSERNVSLAGRLRSRYGLTGMKELEAVACTDKLIMKRKLEQAGVPVIPYWSGLDFIENEENCKSCGEVVVKPLNGSRCRGVIKMSSEEALDYIRNIGYEVIVEEQIKVKQEFHCDGVVEGGVLRHCVSSAYYRPQLAAVGGLNASIQIDPLSREDYKLRNLSELAVQALGITKGVVHVEILSDGRNLWVGEIAGRPGGGGITRYLHLITGLNLWEIFTYQQLGHELDIRCTKEKSDGSWLRIGVPPTAKGIKIDENLKSLGSDIEVYDRRKKKSYTSRSYWPFGSIMYAKTKSMVDAKRFIQEIEKQIKSEKRELLEY